MTKLFCLLLVLIPMAMGHPMDDDDRRMMMQFMRMNEKVMKTHEEKKEDNQEKMLKWMMSMMSRDKDGHYPGDADGCKAEEEHDEWKEKLEKEHEMKKMTEEYRKFKDYMEEKKKAEEKEEEEKKKKMEMMWSQHEEMKKRQEEEEEFREMVESFQTQKHHFAFKMTHEFLQLCECSDINQQLEKMSMLMDSMNQTNGTDLARNMTSEDAAEAMERGDMEMLARKMMHMSAEEKKKVFMSGLIKAMCTGAQTFIKHMGEFEEMYMRDGNSTRPN